MTQDVFTELATKLDAKVQELINSGHTLVRSKIPKEILWNTYLDTIPEEYNQIFRVRRYYDGVYDHQYLNRIGSLMSLHNGELTSIWDIDIDSYFSDVAKQLSELVKSYGIDTYYLSTEKVIGHKPNVDTHEPDLVWEHFYTELPKSVVDTNKDTTLSRRNSDYAVLYRSLEESTIDNIDLIIELIEQNSIYRGQEHLETLKLWKQVKEEFDTVTYDKKLFALEKADSLKSRGRFRNTVIGSLIADLYEGVDLEQAVAKFETKVAPQNYKRTQALITPRQIEQARQKLEELGYLDSIYRALATEADIPTDKILFRTQADKALSVFDELQSDASKDARKLNLSHIREVPYQQFLEVLPQLNKVELLPTSKAESHKVAMTKGTGAKNMLAWDNDFAWTYLNSDTTDAIKEKVKAAGGNVTGDVRFSLSWYNTDDLDLHANTPQGEIFFGRKRVAKGHLDIDMNAGFNLTTEPVENIVWENLSDMPYGTYTVFVDQYNKRNNKDFGFQLQMEIMGETTTFSYTGAVESNFRKNKLITLAVDYNGVNILEINPLLKNESTVSTNKFIDVTRIYNSPNYWGTDKGNKHIIFETNDFAIEEPVRGFFNEYLDPSLTEHRKVFEIMGNKLKIDTGYESAARGYGYSTTSESEAILRIHPKQGGQEVIKVVFK